MTTLCCSVAIFALVALSVPGPALAAVRGARLRRSRQPSSDGMSQTMKAQYPYYHTSDEITDAANALQSQCNDMLSLQTVSGDGVDIQVAKVKAPGSNPVNRVFLLFGEHSRELISPESGLHFLRTLCGQTDLSSRASSVLQNSEFQIVLNGNPNSRRKVEQGDFCLRVNEHGVDLNRNWDEKWEGESMDFANTNPGPSPFSEPETKIFKQLVSDYGPTTFLTVHSGTRGMYMPYAYDMEHLAARNQPEMMSILKKLDEDHCQCPYGAAGKEVGYPCPGTCLDWVYEKLDTPYSFAFEIYTSPEKDESLKERWEEKMSSGGAMLLQQGHSLAHSHFHDIFAQHPTDFIQLRAQHRELFDCFSNFNPDTQDKFEDVIDNWSSAYLDLSEVVAKNLVGSVGQANATVAAPIA